MNQRNLIIAAGIFGIVLMGLILNSFRGDPESGLITSQVDSGVVQKTVAISGYLEADNLVELAFPQPARVSALFVYEGETVEAGQLLVTSGSGAKAAERQKAIALLTHAEATRSTLLNGLTLEARKISSTTVAQAQSAYENTIATEDKKVSNSLASLYSTDLEARTTDASEENNAPTITGSFLCEETGTYNLEVYPSDTKSGYSFRYSGLEEGTLPVSFTQPVRLGDCGLSVQFEDNNSYKNTDWSVQIPNTDSNSYQQRLRAYELTLEQREANIQAAKYTLELARDSFAKDTASPRIESIIEANATVAAAQADVARIDALFSDEAIYAPFKGIVTNINSSVGEVANGPVLQLVTNDAFTLVARIPEIDIAKVKIDQKTRARFDASSDEILNGIVKHISPIATLIDGVSYYEANITLDSLPEWLRDGLNADISIVLEEKTSTSRIESRFIKRTEQGPFVVLRKNKVSVPTQIEVSLVGTNGYTAITGLTEGDIVVAE